MLDATKDDKQIEILESELHTVGIRLNSQPPDIYYKPKKARTTTAPASLLLSSMEVAALLQCQLTTELVSGGHTGWRSRVQQHGPAHPHRREGLQAHPARIQYDSIISLFFNNIYICFINNLYFLIYLFFWLVC